MPFFAILPPDFPLWGISTEGSIEKKTQLGEIAAYFK
jgi:hypothetical protein